MRRIFFACFCILLFALSGCTGSSDEKVSDVTRDTTSRAIETLSKQIQDDGSNPELFNKRAKLYLFDQQFDKALKDINSAIALKPNSAASYIILSDIYLLMGQSQNCNDALIRAMSLEPENTDALLKMAKLYLILKNYPKTYEYIRQILLLDKIAPTAHYLRAIALLEQGDTIRAVADLMQAVDQNQEYFEAYVLLGDLYSLRKDPMTESYLKNALNIRPQSKEAMYMLGMFYQETGKYEKAIETYQNLSKIDTSFKEPVYNIGYIYLVYLSNYKQAIAFFTLALKRDPGYKEAYFNRGYAYELSGDYARAEEDYHRALKVEVNYNKAVEGMNRLDKLKPKK